MSSTGRIFARFLALFIAFTPCAPTWSSEIPSVNSARKVPATELFSRIVVLGASVSAGFDSSQPLGGPKALEYRFSNFLEAALTMPHEPITTEASSLLFLNPPETLETKITAALQAKPTIVIGLDALFWFCYGGGMTNEQRRERFEFGLKLLERIDVPMVIGDIPDASRAIGVILAKQQVPSLELIAECNERLHRWAAERDNVVLFSLSDLMKKATADDELALGRLRWDRGQSKRLLRSDLLHPSRHGLAALAIGVLDFAREKISGLPADVVREDLDEVYSRAVGKPANPATLPGIPAAR